MIFLETKDIVKDFGSHRALDHVNVQIAKGRIYGLLGPNGAGKTTLIRILNRIGIADEGKVIFNGQPMRDKDVRSIGYLPEERGLYPKMKVGEQAIYLSRLKGLEETTATKRLKEWFGKFDILPWWDKKVQELSKGMQQKVQFIITVLHQPDLLIFDEPFSGFDPVNTELIKDEIIKLRDAGATIVFSTHNMQSVEEICDDMGLINHSKLVLQGSVPEIKQQFRGKRYLFTYDTEPMISESLRQWYNTNIVYNHKTAHYDVYVKNSVGKSSTELVQDFLSTGELISFQELIPTINEIFISTVTGKPIEDLKQNIDILTEEHE